MVCYCLITALSSGMDTYLALAGMQWTTTWRDRSSRQMSCPNAKFNLPRPISICPGLYWFAQDYIDLLREISLMGPAGPINGLPSTWSKQPKFHLEFHQIIITSGRWLRACPPQMLKLLENIWSNDPALAKPWLVKNRLNQVNAGFWRWAHTQNLPQSNFQKRPCFWLEIMFLENLVTVLTGQTDRQQPFKL